MSVLYQTTPGGTLAARSRALLLRRDGRLEREAPAADVERVAVLAPAHLTSGAISLCLRLGIEIVVVAHGAHVVARLGVSEAALRLRAAQLRRADDPAFRIDLARAIVRAKLRNARQALARSRDAREPPVRAACAALDRMLHRVNTASTIERLRGLEGRGSVHYFRGLAARLNPEFGFRTRNRRPPRDPANALLSFAYTLLTAEAVAALAAAGFEPALGFFHEPRAARPALALDLVEEFRAPVADALCVRVTSLRIVRATDFRTRGEAVLLKPAARRRFLAAYEDKLAAPLAPRSGRPVPARETIRAQAGLLARTVETGEPYVPFDFRG